MIGTFVLSLLTTDFDVSSSSSVSSDVPSSFGSDRGVIVGTRGDVCANAGSTAGPSERRAGGSRARWRRSLQPLQGRFLQWGGLLQSRG